MKWMNSIGKTEKNPTGNFPDSDFLTRSMDLDTEERNRNNSKSFGLR
jgi:hypothetical protein